MNTTIIASRPDTIVAEPGSALAILAEDLANEGGEPDKNDPRMAWAHVAAGEPVPASAVWAALAKENDNSKHDLHWPDRAQWIAEELGTASPLSYLLRRVAADVLLHGLPGNGGLPYQRGVRGAVHRALSLGAHSEVAVRVLTALAAQAQFEYRAPGGGLLSGDTVLAGLDADQVAKVAWRAADAVEARDQVHVAIADVREAAARGWSPEVQRLAWRAALLAVAAGMHVTFALADESSSDLRLVIAADERGDNVLLDTIVWAGYSQGGVQITPAELNQ